MSATNDTSRIIDVLCESEERSRMAALLSNCGLPKTAAFVTKQAADARAAARRLASL